MNLMFGVLLGGLLVVIGLITAVFAPRVGPNPFFGVRTGYSYANRGVWDQSNRVGGLAMSAIGGLLIVLTGILWLVGLGPAQAMLILTGVMLVSLLGMTGWLFMYTRRLALGTDFSQTLTPVVFDPRALLPPVGAWALLALTALALYPSLPPVLATHFDLAGQPDGWSRRESFFVFYLGLAAMMTLIPVGIALIAQREPVIGLSRLGGWRLDPMYGIRVVAWIMALTNLFLLMILLDLAWFAWYGAHVVSLPLLVTAFTVALLGSLVALFFRYARREPT